MLNIVLIISFIAAIIVSAVFAGMTFLYGVQSALDAQITRQRLVEVASQIQTHARYITGYYALPQGSTGSSPYAYNQVPSWITGNAHNSAGVPFEYCPYADANTSGGTASTVAMGSGTTYNIKYTNSALTISQNYVTDNNGTSVPITGIYGLLVAAAPNKFVPPNCSSVTTSSGYPTVAGGIAVAIQNDYSNKMQVPSAMTDMKFYVSTSASGDNSGRDTSNYTTLSNALTIISTLKPASAMIYLDATGSPTYNLTTVNGTTFSYGTRIYLQGISSGATVNTSTSLTIDEYSLLSIGNITFNINSGAGTIKVNGTLEMADSRPTLTAGTIQVYGGKINGHSTSMTFTGNVTIDGGGRIACFGCTQTFNSLGNRGLKIISGQLLPGTSNFNPAAANTVPIYVGSGGIFYVGSSTATINATNTYTMTGGVIIDPGGKLAQHNTTLQVNNVSSYAYYNHGVMYITGGNLYYRNLPGGGLTDGIILASGGWLEMSGAIATTIGETSPNRPTYGIDDKGGSVFSTGNYATSQTIHAATNCWRSTNATMGLFNDSSAGSVSAQVSEALLTSGKRWLRLYNASYSTSCTIS